MCGIAGVYLRDPSFDVDLDGMLDTLLDDIEARGKHATGYVAIGESETLEWQKAACDASTFIKYRRLIPDGARGVLAHTRWATQGLPAFMENNHPIKRGPFFIIHNGHVNNDGTLFKDAERDRFGEVDSEAIAARLSSYGDLKFLGNVMEEIDGDAAVAAVDERDGGIFAVARGHGSPLYVLNGTRIVVFASTRSAVEAAYTNHIGRLPKGQPKYIDEGTMLYWKGENTYWTKELLLPKQYKYVYTPSSYSTYSQPALGTGKSSDKAATPDEISEYWQRLSDEDVIQCDNCSIDVSWKDSYYFYDPPTKITWSLCEDCYDHAAFQRSQAEAEDAEWQELYEDDVLTEYGLSSSCAVAGFDDDYTRPVDDFEGANNSILRLIEKMRRRGSTV